MTGTDWTGTREAVAALAADPPAQADGTNLGHGWTLEPPLSADELAEVESQLGVELPEEYRSFLLQVSRGGAGPAYGLFPLVKVDGSWRWEGDGAGLSELEMLGVPFPYTDAFNPAEGLPEPPDEDDYETEEQFNAAEDAYWERHDEVVHDPAHYAGLLYLCHLGCAYREALVVSGPARGTMWGDNTAADEGLEPLHDDDGSPLGFARWYRRWLEEGAAPAS